MRRLRADEWVNALSNNDDLGAHGVHIVSDGPAARNPRTIVACTISCASLSNDGETRAKARGVGS